MIDIVFIRGLRLETCIGIHPWERQVTRPVFLDLELAADTRRAAATDRLEDALDYEAVARRLRELVTQSRYALVETLAERCAEVLQSEFGISWLRLVLNKPGAIGEETEVGVIIERGSRASN